MPNQTLLSVKVKGDFACFTRPEMKVERVSYPVMTPSAARGVLEAIFWKPEFAWQVAAIETLEPIRYLSIRRNEIMGRQTEQTARGWERNGGYFTVDDPGGGRPFPNRTQRHTLALRDVGYIIHARQTIKPGVDADPAKYQDQFRRRVNTGRCFAIPYLGCREFAVSEFGPPNGTETPIDITEDLGSMLLKMVYDPDASGKATPLFFNARLERGVLTVPDDDNRQEASL